MKLLISENQLTKVNEEVNPLVSSSVKSLGQRWHHERYTLKNFIVNYGETMMSRENGKMYKVIFDPFISNKLGINYCLCIQYDYLTRDAGEIVYVRAYDKFERRG